MAPDFGGLLFQFPAIPIPSTAFLVGTKKILGSPPCARELGPSLVGDFSKVSEQVEACVSQAQCLELAVDVGGVEHVF